MNIEEYIKNNLPLPGRFYMPGHKGALSPLDVTETFGTDDLRNPKSILKEAQKKVADICGAENSFFLVGGSTLGIQAMITACVLQAASLRGEQGVPESACTFGEEEQLRSVATLIAPKGAIVAAEQIVTRDVATNCFPNLQNFEELKNAIHNKKRKIIVDEYHHISLRNVAILLNLDIVILPREKLDHWNIDKKLEINEKVIKENQDAIGVFITSPTYYGITSDIPNISNLCHKYSLPLLVDEAHGAHFGFHENLPQSAITQGADLCVQSVHKTLPSLTQTAVLHQSKNSIINSEKIQTALNLFQTTSPSYLFMISIENSIDFAYHNKDKFAWLINKCQDFRKSHNCLVNEDITRLVFKSNIEELKSKGIWAEKSDKYNNIILIPSICNTAEDFSLLEKI